MKTSADLKNFAAAMNEVQAKLKPMLRNAANPFFKSTYTDLASLTEQLYPLATAHGFSVVQGGDGSNLSTLILHTSGEWVETSLPMPAETNPQKLGSIVSYFRRYALAAAFGAASEGEDDDGNAASHPSPRSPSAPPPANRPPAESGARPTPPAPAARATGAGPASPGDALEVTDFKESEGVNAKGNPWKRFTATFNNGVRASTFDTKHGEMLKEAHEKGEPVIVTFQKSGNFTNIIGVELFPF